MMRNTLKKNLDRRIIYVILIIGVALPLIYPFGLKSEISEISRQVYRLIESTKDNSTMILSFDYDPATNTELQPMAKAIIEHAWQRNHKIIAIALWPMGVQMAEQAFDSVKDKLQGKKYGIDYVNLGYKTGGIVTIQAMGRSLQQVFPKDIKNTNYSDLPMLKSVKNYKQISYIVSLSAGDPGLKQYVMAAHDMYKVKVTGGTTAVSIPGFLPYINDQNQLHGLLGGLKGAAEYESLIKVKGTATSGMDAQSIAHLIIIMFIIIGNLRIHLSKK